MHGLMLMLSVLGVVRLARWLAGSPTPTSQRREWVIARTGGLEAKPSDPGIVERW